MAKAGVDLFPVSFNLLSFWYFLRLPMSARNPYNTDICAYMYVCVGLRSTYVGLNHASAGSGEFILSPPACNLRLRESNQGTDHLYTMYKWNMVKPLKQTSWKRLVINRRHGQEVLSKCSNLDSISLRVSAFGWLSMWVLVCVWLQLLTIGLKTIVTYFV